MQKTLCWLTVLMILLSSCLLPSLAESDDEYSSFTLDYAKDICFYKGQVYALEEFLIYRCDEPHAVQLPIPIVDDPDQSIIFHGYKSFLVDESDNLYLVYTFIHTSDITLSDQQQTIPWAKYCIARYDPTQPVNQLTPIFSYELDTNDIDDFRFAAMTADKILLQVENTIVCGDRQTGKVSTRMEPRKCIGLSQHNEIILFEEGYTSYATYSTWNAWQPTQTLPCGSFHSFPLFDGRQNTLYYVDRAQLYRVNAEETKAVAYVPLRLDSIHAKAVLAGERRILIANENKLHWVEIDESYQAIEKLQILGNTLSGNAILESTILSHPEMPINFALPPSGWIDPAGVGQLILQKDDTTDLFFLDTNVKGWKEFQKKGYGKPFESSALQALVHTMPEVIAAQLISPGNELTAFPDYLDMGSVLRYSNEAAETMDILSLEPLPSHWQGLLETLTKWSKNGTLGDLPIFDGYRSGLSLLTHMLTDYLRWAYNRHNGMHVDEDSLLPLLQAAESLIEAERERSPSGDTPFLETVPLATYIMDDSGQYTYILPTMTKDEPYAAVFNMSVATINPLSKRSAQAEELMVSFLESMLANQGVTYSMGLEQQMILKMAFDPASAEPIEDPNFHRVIDEIQHGTQFLMEQSEKPDALHDREHDDALSSQEQTIKNLEEDLDFRWILSEHDIRRFREMLPHLMPSRPEIMTLVLETYDALNMYLDGNMTAEAYVNELERVVQMMRAEQGD